MTAAMLIEGMFLAFLVVGWGVLALELISGYAVVGFTGRVQLAQRRKLPVPYWFSISLHVPLFGICPALLYFGRAWVAA